MADERRYRDEEVEEIFDLAVTTDDARQIVSADQDGLTLAELQEVGLEIDVDPTRIAEAARALETRSDVVTSRTSVGMPISVGRLVQLHRAVTDDEWDLMVQELRETVGERGQIASHGGVRQWTGGTVHAFLEPTETGHQLRLTIDKGGATALNRVGITSLAIGVTLFAAILITGMSPVNMELAMLSLFGLGGGILTANKLTLPRWAHDREGQMEYIAARMRARIGDRPSGDESAT